MKYVVGIDVGGTFTDCVVVDEDGSVVTDKSYTVPANPGEGMIAALENVAAGRDPVDRILQNARAFAIGTTSLTNKLITRSGAKVGLITTRGHEDAILIGRIISKSEGLSEAEKADTLCWSKPEPIVARRHIRGISERIDYKGSVIVKLDESEVAQTVSGLVSEGVEAIAVCLLWGFINPAHELCIQSYIAKHHPSVYVAVGSSVAPVLGEYERTNSTILSAYLGTIARREMEVTKSLLGTRGLSRPFLVMQSNGGCMWDEEVPSAPLNLIASGPAGGIIGCAKLGERMGYRNIIATDMGGTSFDVGVIADGAPILADIAVHDRIRMALPHVDVVSIGAGGGSIAWVDESTGLLHVGPRSAGSVPGPVAYGQGGEEPTVTDADVVLGRIDPQRFFSGRRPLDHAKAETAIKTKVADVLGCDVHTAAKGIIDIVDARMGDLIRKLTIERGARSPRFRAVRIRRRGAHPCGRLCEGDRHPHGRSLALRLGLLGAWALLRPMSCASIPCRARSLAVRSGPDKRAVSRARGDREGGFAKAGRGSGDTTFARSCRDAFSSSDAPGQSAGVERDADRTRCSSKSPNGFIAMYEQTFGRGTAVVEAGVEILTFQLVATHPSRHLTLEKRAAWRARTRAQPAPVRGRSISTARLSTPPSTSMTAFMPGNKIAGPAIIESGNTTMPLHPTDTLTVDAFSNLVIRFADTP